MIIENNLKKKTCPFEALFEGDVFTDLDWMHFYMKTPIHILADDFNAISLEDGSFMLFEDEEDVIPLPSAKVVVS